MMEDLQHALMYCSHVKQYWAATREILDRKLPRLHLSTWAKDIVVDGMISEQDRCKLITVINAIWTTCNRWAHDQQVFDPVQ